MAKTNNSDLVMPTIIAILAVVGLIAVSQFFSSVNEVTITSAAQSDLTDFSKDCYDQGKVIEEVVQNDQITFVCKEITDVGNN